MITEQELPEVNNPAEVRVSLLRKFNFRGSVVSYAIVNAQPLLNATVNSDMKRKLEPVEVIDTDSNSVKTRKIAEIARIICKFTVSRYEDSEKNQISGDLDAITEISPAQNLTKLMLVSAAHLKGTWLTKGKYICDKSQTKSNCAKVFHADIDPRADVPEGLDDDRIPMTDIRDYYLETKDKFTNGIYEHTYKAPIDLLGPDKLPMTVTKITVTAPSFSTFKRAHMEAKRMMNPGLWMIHDSIININDYNEEDTKKIISANSFDAIMSFKDLRDKNELIEVCNNSAYWTFKDFELQCNNCMGETVLPFDASTHFLSLYK